MEVVWSEPAEDDLLRVFEFNLGRNLDWAVRVDDRLWTGADMLARAPGMGRPVAGTDIRLLSLVDVQYVITYRIDGDRVRILGVRSTREA